jgi:putative membrane protein
MRMEVTRIGLGLLLVVAAGCQGKSGGGRPDQSSAANSTSTDTAAKPTTTTPRAGLSDSNIVALLDEANEADSAAGAIALKKAANPEVKAFAKLMMSEHHALRAAGQDLAKQLGITPKAPEHDPIAGYARTELVDLQKQAKGPDFDKLYIDHEVSVHQAVLDFANMARVTTQTPQLRDLIQKAIPVIQKHLEQAQGIQKKLTPAA